MEDQFEQQLSDLLDVQGDRESIEPKDYSVDDVNACFSYETVSTTFDKTASSLHQNRRLFFGRPQVEQQGPISSSSSSTIVSRESNSSTDASSQWIRLSQMATRIQYEWSHRIWWGRTLRDAFVLNGAVWTLVADASNSDHVVIISFWNYLPLFSNRSKDILDYDEITDMKLELPMDTYLALVNPLLVRNHMWEMSTGDDAASSQIMLRCDNPECLRLYDNQQEWIAAIKESGCPHFPTSLPVQIPQTVEQLKDRGDHCFAQKAYRAALRFYRQAYVAATSIASTACADLAMSILDAMLNTCLALEKFDDAENFARHLLDTYDSQHFSARRGLATALLYQNQPTAAKDMLLQLRQDDPENGAMYQQLLGDCIQAIMEQNMGRFNIRKMLQQAAVSPFLPHHADFQSPAIDLGVPVIRPSDGVTYRGVLAKQDILEGTLLSATRAFAFAYQQKQDQPGIYSDQIRLAKKKHLYEVSHVHAAVNKLLNNPSLAASFYQLESFGKVRTNEGHRNKQPTVDLAKIRSVLESNRFGMDLNSPASPFELKPPGMEEKGESLGVGLWLATSMFNHSCTPNCTWAQVGNHMFVHSVKNISKGEELCVSYVHTALSYQDRKDKFGRWCGGMGFVCGCEWCHLLRGNSKLRDMNEETVLALKRLNSGAVINSIDELISSARRRQIKKAHSKLPKRFQHSLYNIHMIEALQYASEMNRKGAKESVEAAVSLGYAIRGGSRQETRMQDLCCLAAVYMTCNEDKKAKEALEALCKHQLLLPAFSDFQRFVMMSSIAFWGAYPSEPFLQRWAELNQLVWEGRSAELL